MSTRAIRALRGGAALHTGIPPTVTDREDEDSDEELVQRRPAAFSMINDDDSSSSSDCEEIDDQKASGSSQNKKEFVPIAPTANSNDSAVVRMIDEDEEEEDLDALLTEFQEKDHSLPQLDDTTQALAGLNDTPFDCILKSIDTRDLDYEYSMRNSILLNCGGEAPATGSVQQQRHRKAPLFGCSSEGWARPPRWVGGGIGMTTYDTDDTTRQMPWPYSADGGEATPSSQWYTFLHSEIYQRDLHDYTNVIQQSGDLDALVVFVTHHPYVTAALLQLTVVLYQTNHSQEGLALLRRCLWVYESSSLFSFINQISTGKAIFMDNDRPENAVFFQALFRLIQVSNIAGYVKRRRTAVHIFSLDNSSLFLFDWL